MHYYYVSTTKTGHATVKVVSFIDDQQFDTERETRTRTAKTIKGIHHPPGGAGAKVRAKRQIHILEVFAGTLEFTTAGQGATSIYRIGPDEGIQGVIFADWEEVSGVGGHSSRNGDEEVRFWLTILEANSEEEIPKLPVEEVEQ